MTDSLLTNTSAMTALLALNQTQQSLATYENQVSTGKSVATAADNAAYWSIATTMSSQVGSLNAVSASLSESSSLLSTMSAALNSVVSVMNGLQQNLTTALSYASEGSTSDLANVQSMISEQQQQLISIGGSSVFNGVNFLDTTGGNVQLLASYNQLTGASYISVNTSSTQLFETAATTATQGVLGAKGTNYTSASILTLSVTSATAGDISNMLKDVQSAITSLTTAASTLGADQNNVTSQQNFISNLTDSLTAGVGSLVDADMNEASTKISALQVQQQLGVQALAIANSNTQMILKLFGL
ncbi:MAG TPA: flagellin [Methylovirgula sp.]|nr:flagellin [Methylovirgula sp.]